MADRRFGVTALDGHGILPAHELGGTNNAASVTPCTGKSLVLAAVAPNIRYGFETDVDDESMYESTWERATA